jgi:hypothetical protein
MHFIAIIIFNKMYAILLIVHITILLFVVAVAATKTIAAVTLAEAAAMLTAEARTKAQR